MTSFCVQWKKISFVESCNLTLFPYQDGDVGVDSSGNTNTQLPLQQRIFPGLELSDSGIAKVL